jgi:hypothetical protein
VIWLIDSLQNTSSKIVFVVLQLLYDSLPGFDRQSHEL